MKKRSSPWFRRIEIALWLLGISLFGGALGATIERWQYQSEQQALFDTAPAPPAPMEQQAINHIAGVPIDESTQRSGAQRSGLKSEPTPSPGLPSKAEPTLDRTERKGLPARPAPSPEPITRIAKKKTDPLAIARIEIPRIGVAAVIREGADEKTLDRAVGLVPGTSRPGENGNIVLAGHRDTFFRPLRKIKVDDRIRVVVPGSTYEYRVDSTRVVQPTDTSVLESNGIEQLTLITCYPFRFIGPAPERFIVTATRVQ